MKRLSFSLRRRKAYESGQAALALVTLVPALMLLVGLVADTGHFLLVRRRAQMAVDSAAVAAATALNEARFKNTNTVALKPELAQAAASRYATTNYPGFPIACAVNGAQVDCVGSADVPTYFLRLVGISRVRIGAHASAELKYGITREGQ